MFVDEIPESESEKFRPFMHIYHKGGLIIAEGDQDDKGLFLLRQGEVSIFKGQGKARMLISNIKAINFFGEMSIISGVPRTATVEAFSDVVVVYAFRSPDLATLISNPKWGHMLISRFSENLKDSNDLVVQLRQENKVLNDTIEHLVKEVVTIFSLTNDVQRSIAKDAVSTAREWVYLNAIVELVQRLLAARLPGIASRVAPVDLKVWASLHQSGLIPTVIFDYMKEAEKKRQGPLEMKGPQ